ncbi:MAG: dihydroneopterin aldolase [Pseudomonadota bacterium]|nr:dihydroneopterin aldolase [Pseudomonadota bacterium]
MTEEVKLHGMVPLAIKVRQQRILIDSLEVMADIGFHDYEVGTPQRLLISVELWLDDLAPPPNDDPGAAWDYDFVVRQVRQLATERRYNLQETLLHAIFERIAGARGVAALRVASNKPDVYPDARGVGVEISSFIGAAPSLQQFIER